MTQELEETGMVSRTYLSIFLMDVNNIKDSLAAYSSIILRLSIQTSQNTDQIFKGLDEQTKNTVIALSDSVRHDVWRCMVSATALKEILPEINITTLQSSYEKIVKQFTPNLEEVSSFCFEINKIFVKSTIEKMLRKMERFHAEFTS